MKKEVLIIYNYIAHYRIPIFNLLSSSSTHEYTIASGDKTDIPIRIMNPSISITPIKDGGVNWKKINNYWLFKLFLFQPKTIVFSLSSKYDTIIFLGNMYYITTWICALLARLRGKKVIFWTHGYIREEKNFQGFLRKIFCKLANEILVYGQRAKDILIEKRFDERRVSLIYNSLDFKSQVNIFKDL